MNRSPIERSSGYIEKQFVVAGKSRLWKRRWSATKASPGDVVSSISHVPSLLDGIIYDTVDGRNPAPVNMVNVTLFTGFYTSQVVHDFFHQQ